MAHWLAFADMSASAHNPSCLGMWWRLLANRSWVRLCSDGCHRISTEGYMLITVGFLAKGPRNDRSKGRVASSENFVRTNFYEAGFAMVSKEASATYGRTFQALTKAMELCCQVKKSDFTACIKQVHADLHAGIESARRLEFPESKRCMDYAHMTGACRQRVGVPSVEACSTLWLCEVWIVRVSSTYDNIINIWTMVKRCYVGMLFSAAFSSKNVWFPLMSCGGR